jgi:glutaconate CoA-transferase subunit B
MRIRSLHPGVTVEEVVALMGFRPEMPEEIPVTAPPGAAEVDLIRKTIDPRRLLLAHEPEGAAMKRSG